MKNKFLIILTMISASIFGSNQEYIYPIAELNDENILVMHQKNIDELELLIWNTKTKLAIKELSSMYLPAHIQVLPSKTGYSFIDKGRIRIKFFQKRAPKSLDIYQPICDIQSLKWITDTQCYFAAKYHNNYQIFMYDTEYQGGTLFCLTNIDQKVNSIFPSKVDDTLFFLLQTEHGYSVASQQWNPVAFNSEVDDINNQSPRKLLNDQAAFCFLSMIDSKKGFVLELQHTTSTDNQYAFQCYLLMYHESDDAWVKQTLFTFLLPSDLVVGYKENRLYESIYPLLPYYKNQTIFFASTSILTNTCVMYTYDLVSGQISPVTQSRSISSSSQHVFSTIVANNKAYHGCSFSFKRGIGCPIDINEAIGIITVDLPESPL